MSNSNPKPASNSAVPIDQFYRDIVDSLDAQLAVIDQAGIIRYVNEAWRSFACENGAAPDASDLGVDYLALTAASTGEGSDNAPDVFKGLSAVLSGAVDYFEIEYPCFTATEDLWFLMRVFPLAGTEPRWAVMTHHNVTRRRRASQDQAAAEREEAQQREQSSLAKLSEPTPTDVTAQTFGMQLLRHSMPQAFKQLSAEYLGLLDRAVELRAYKDESGSELRLRALAEQLAFLRAGPRDVIDLHMTALRLKGENLSTAATQVYMEEARLLVLELMGHLTSIYRGEAFGIKTTDPERRSL